jgi:hypothetical protein
MTRLIGGSALLIAVSAIALVLGWASADERLIWASILSSGAAAVALSVAFYRSKQEVAEARMRSVAAAAEPAAATAPHTGLNTQAIRPETPSQTRLDSRPNGSPGDPDVVAIPARRRYHRPECRYSKAAGAQRMPLSSARRRQFNACSVCKP